MLHLRGVHVGEAADPPLLVGTLVDGLGGGFERGVDLADGAADGGRGISFSLSKSVEIFITAILPNSCRSAKRPRAAGMFMRSYSIGRNITRRGYQ